MTAQVLEVPRLHAAAPPARMIDVDEARRRILAAFRPLPMTTVALADALGSVLAVDVVDGISVPAFPHAPMDGFAVLAADTADASAAHPVTLRVMAEVAAGAVSTTPVTPGTAARIMTGAPVPTGADAVVRFEETEEGAGDRHCGPGDTIAIYKAAMPGENIRPIGEDVSAGETVLTAGTRVRPAEIGVLATLNRTHATVHQRPRVGILATGDELVEPGEPLGPGQIRNSNAPMLAALVHRFAGHGPRHGSRSARSPGARRGAGSPPHHRRRLGR